MIELPMFMCGATPSDGRVPCGELLIEECGKEFPRLMHGRECVDEGLSEEACAAAKECICVLRLCKACRIVSAEYFFLYLQAV